MPGLVSTVLGPRPGHGLGLPMGDSTKSTELWSGGGAKGCTLTMQSLPSRRAQPGLTS